MADKYAISILMANFNKGKYVAEAIESVIAQTSPDWQLVIVDDCSTDDSVEIIGRYLDEPRIKFARNEKNLGKIKTLRKLIEISDYEILGILDSDDALEPDAVEEILSAYESHPECGLVYSQFANYDQAMNFLSLGYGKRLAPGSSNLLVPSTVHFVTFKKECYCQTEGYDDDILFSEDVDILFKLEEVTALYFIDKALYKYRRVPFSFTTDRINREINRASCALAKYKAYKRRLGTSFPNISRLEASCQLYYAALVLLKIGDWVRIKKFLKLAFATYPFNFKAPGVIFIRIIKFPFYFLYKKIFDKKGFA